MSRQKPRTRSWSTIRADKVRISLGYLCLGLPLIALVLQYHQVGLFMTAGTALPLSDSNVWAGCASSLASLETPVNLGWCLKRPLAMFIQAPAFVLAPYSMAAVILLQVTGMSALFWWLLVTIDDVLAVPKWSTFVVYFVGAWPILWYGTYLGPEAPALALSLLSAVAFLKFCRGLNALWGFLACACAAVCLLIRPGNPLLVIGLLVGIVVVLWRVRRRRLLGILVGTGVLLVAWAPIQLMRALGWSDAGHGSNFWFTLYSAATPESDTWLDAYLHYAALVGCQTTFSPDPCLALDSLAFASRIQADTVALVLQDPLAIPHQMLTNLATAARAGYIGNVLGWPYPSLFPRVEPPAGHETTFALGSLATTVMQAASWVLLVALTVAFVAPRIAVLGRKRTLLFCRREQSFELSAAQLLGIVTILGCIGFFALVGHDEQQRHMVQNVPFLLIAVSACFASYFTRSDREGLRTPQPRKAMLASTVPVAVAMIIIVGAVVEGHSTSPVVRVLSSCGAELSTAEEFSVISSLSVGGGTASGNPANWRLAQRSQSVVLPAGYSWTASQLEMLPPGTLVELKSRSSGNVLPFFVSAADRPRLNDDLWCRVSPSTHGSMLVYDLISAVNSGAQS